MKKSIQLLIIDPQNDFCDVPADWRPRDMATGQTVAPALPVAGAHADMLRVAQLITDGAAGITAIAITLDSHHRLDIAHPTFWKTAAGSEVVPFTAITAAQVRGGAYQPRDPAALSRALAYLDELEQRDRYTLMVWPVHCEIGSWGHNVHAAVKQAYNRWEDGCLKVVQKINKGSNPWTEHYSAMQAEVPADDDPATQMNMDLIRQLDQADQIIIAGEASSHCVRATTEHIVENLPSGEPSKLVLLTDCMSPVGGFDAQHIAFLNAMRHRGVLLSSSADILPQLIANS